MKKLKSLYEYFFAPWNIEIVKRGHEQWYSCYQHCESKIPDSEYQREYVLYKYSHKYRKEEKIVKEYLN